MLDILSSWNHWFSTMMLQTWFACVVILGASIGGVFLLRATTDWVHVYVNDANKILFAVGLKMEPKPNSEGSHNIVTIETNEVVGKQPVMLNLTTEVWNHSVVRWVYQSAYSEGYAAGKAKRG